MEDQEILRTHCSIHAKKVELPLRIHFSDKVQAKQKSLERKSEKKNNRIDIF